MSQIISINDNQQLSREQRSILDLLGGNGKIDQLIDTVKSMPNDTKETDTKSIQNKCCSLLQNLTQHECTKNSQKCVKDLYKFLTNEDLQEKTLTNQSQEKMIILTTKQLKKMIASLVYLFISFSQNNSESKKMFFEKLSKSIENMDDLVQYLDVKYQNMITDDKKKNGGFAKKGGADEVTITIDRDAFVGSIRSSENQEPVITIYALSNIVLEITDSIYQFIKIIKKKETQLNEDIAKFLKSLMGQIYIAIQFLPKNSSEQEVNTTISAISTPTDLQNFKSQILFVTDTMGVILSNFKIFVQDAKHGVVIPSDALDIINKIISQTKTFRQKLEDTKYTDELKLNIQEVINQVFRQIDNVGKMYGDIKGIMNIFSAQAVAKSIGLENKETFAKYIKQLQSINAVFVKKMLEVTEKSGYKHYFTSKEIVDLAAGKLGSYIKQGQFSRVKEGDKNGREFTALLGFGFILQQVDRVIKVCQEKEFGKIADITVEWEKVMDQSSVSSQESIGFLDDLKSMFPLFGIDNINEVQTKADYDVIEKSKKDSIAAHKSENAKKFDENIYKFKRALSKISRLEPIVTYFYKTIDAIITPEEKKSNGIVLSFTGADTVSPQQFAAICDEFLLYNNLTYNKDENDNYFVSQQILSDSVATYQDGSLFEVLPKQIIDYINYYTNILLRVLASKGLANATTLAALNLGFKEFDKKGIQQATGTVVVGTSIDVSIPKMYMKFFNCQENEFDKHFAEYYTKYLATQYKQDATVVGSVQKILQAFSKHMFQQIPFLSEKQKDEIGTNLDAEWTTLLTVAEVRTMIAQLDSVPLFVVMMVSDTEYNLGGKVDSVTATDNIVAQKLVHGSRHADLIDLIRTNRYANGGNIGDKKMSDTSTPPKITNFTTKSILGLLLETTGVTKDTNINENNERPGSDPLAVAAITDVMRQIKSFTEVKTRNISVGAFNDGILISIIRAQCVAQQAMLLHKEYNVFTNQLYFDIVSTLTEFVLLHTGNDNNVAVDQGIDSTTVRKRFYYGGSDLQNKIVSINDSSIKLLIKKHPKFFLEGYLVTKFIYNVIQQSVNGMIYKRDVAKPENLISTVFFNPNASNDEKINTSIRVISYILNTFPGLEYNDLMIKLIQTVQSDLEVFGIQDLTTEDKNHLPNAITKLFENPMITFDKDIPFNPNAITEDEQKSVYEIFKSKYFAYRDIVSQVIRNISTTLNLVNTQDLRHYQEWIRQSSDKLTKSDTDDQAYNRLLDIITKGTDTYKVDNILLQLLQTYSSLFSVNDPLLFSVENDGSVNIQASKDNGSQFYGNYLSLSMKNFTESDASSSKTILEQYSNEVQKYIENGSSQTNIARTIRDSIVEQSLLSDVYQQHNAAMYTFLQTILRVKLLAFPHSKVQSALDVILQRYFLLNVDTNKKIVSDTRPIQSMIMDLLRAKKIMLIPPELEVANPAFTTQSPLYLKALGTGLPKGDAIYADTNASLSDNQVTYTLEPNGQSLDWQYHENLNDGQKLCLAQSLLQGGILNSQTELQTIMGGKFDDTAGKYMYTSFPIINASDYTISKTGTGDDHKIVKSYSQISSLVDNQIEEYKYELNTVDSYPGLPSYRKSTADSNKRFHWNQIENKHYKHFSIPEFNLTTHERVVHTKYDNLLNTTSTAKTSDRINFYNELSPYHAQQQFLENNVSKTEECRLVGGIEGNAAIANSKSYMSTNDTNLSTFAVAGGFTKDMLAYSPQQYMPSVLTINENQTASGQGYGGIPDLLKVLNASSRTVQLLQEQNEQKAIKEMIQTFKEIVLKSDTDGYLQSATSNVLQMLVSKIAAIGQKASKKQSFQQYAEINKFTSACPYNSEDQKDPLLQVIYNTRPQFKVPTIGITNQPMGKHNMKVSTVAAGNGKTAGVPGGYEIGNSGQATLSCVLNGISIPVSVANPDINFGTVIKTGGYDTTEMFTYNNQFSNQMFMELKGKLPSFDLLMNYLQEKHLFDLFSSRTSPAIVSTFVSAAGGATLLPASDNADDFHAWLNLATKAKKDELIKHFGNSTFVDYLLRDVAGHTTAAEAYQFIVDDLFTICSFVVSANGVENVLTNTTDLVNQHFKLLAKQFVGNQYVLGTQMDLYLSDLSSFNLSQKKTSYNNNVETLSMNPGDRFNTGAKFCSNEYKDVMETVRSEKIKMLYNVIKDNSGNVVQKETVNEYKKLREKSYYDYQQKVGSDYASPIENQYMPSLLINHRLLEYMSNILNKCKVYAIMTNNIQRQSAISKIERYIQEVTIGGDSPHFLKSVYGFFGLMSSCLNIYAGSQTEFVKHFAESNGLSDIVETDYGKVYDMYLKKDTLDEQHYMNIDTLLHMYIHQNLDTIYAQINPDQAKLGLAAVEYADNIGRFNNSAKQQAFNKASVLNFIISPLKQTVNESVSPLYTLLQEHLQKTIQIIKIPDTQLVPPQYDYQMYKEKMEDRIMESNIEVTTNGYSKWPILAWYHDQDRPYTYMLARMLQGQDMTIYESAYKKMLENVAPSKLEILKSYMKQVRKTWLAANLLYKKININETITSVKRKNTTSVEGDFVSATDSQPDPYAGTKPQLYRQYIFPGHLYQSKPIDLLDIPAIQTQKNEDVRMNTLAVINTGLLPFQPDKLMNVPYTYIAKMSSLMRGSLYKLPLPQGRSRDFVALTVSDVVRIFALNGVSINKYFSEFQVNNVFSTQSLTKTITDRICPTMELLFGSDIMLEKKGWQTISSGYLNGNVPYKANENDIAAIINLPINIDDLTDTKCTLYLSMYPSYKGYEAIVVSSEGNIICRTIADYFEQFKSQKFVEIVQKGKDVPNIQIKHIGTGGKDIARSGTNEVTISINKEIVSKLGADKYEHNIFEEIGSNGKLNVIQKDEDRHKNITVEYGNQGLSLTYYKSVPGDTIQFDVISKIVSLVGSTMPYFTNVTSVENQSITVIQKLREAIVLSILQKDLLWYEKQAINKMRPSEGSVLRLFK